jgi:hypothetical protein
LFFYSNSGKLEYNSELKINFINAQLRQYSDEDTNWETGFRFPNGRLGEEFLSSLRFQVGLGIVQLLYNGYRDLLAWGAGVVYAADLPPPSNAEVNVLSYSHTRAESYGFVGFSA